MNYFIVLRTIACCLTYFNVWMQNMFFQQCKWVRGSPYKVVLNTFETEKNTKEVIRSRYDPRTIRQNTIDGVNEIATPVDN
jgi:hypothetical protein